MSISAGCYVVLKSLWRDGCCFYDTVSCFPELWRHHLTWCVFRSSFLLQFASIAGGGPNRPLNTPGGASFFYNNPNAGGAGQGAGPGGAGGPGNAGNPGNAGGAPTGALGCTFVLYVVLCFDVCALEIALCGTALSAQLCVVGKRVSSQRLRTRLIVFVVTHTDCAW
jgi:hypothetical protein